jgi:hypothetical protein
MRIRVSGMEKNSDPGWEKFGSVIRDGKNIRDKHPDPALDPDPDPSIIKQI